MIEVWLASPVFGDRYEVSNLGRVRSKAGVKATYRDKDGYPVVNLHCAGKRRACPVHRLVAVAFHPEKRNELHKEVAHLDGDRANPRADNLKWVSKVENHSHMKAHGTHVSGERNGFAKLTEAQAREIKSARGVERALNVARRFGISRRTVFDIWSGHRWPHLAEARQPGPKDAPDQPPEHPITTPQESMK